MNSDLELFFNRRLHQLHDRAHVLLDEAGEAIPSEDREDLLAAIDMAIDHTKNGQYTNDDAALCKVVKDALLPVPPLFELHPDLHNNPIRENRDRFEFGRALLQDIGLKIAEYRFSEPRPFMHPVFTALSDHSRELGRTLDAIGRHYHKNGFPEEARKHLAPFLESFRYYEAVLQPLLDIQELPKANALKQGVLEKFLDTLQPFDAAALRERMETGETLALRHNTPETMHLWANTWHTLTEIARLVFNEANPDSPLRSRVGKEFNYARPRQEPETLSNSASPFAASRSAALAKEREKPLHELFLPYLVALTQFSDELITSEGGRGVPDHEKEELFSAIDTATMHTQNPEYQEDEAALCRVVKEALRTAQRIYELNPALHSNPTPDGRNAYEAFRHTLQYIGLQIAERFPEEKGLFVHPLIIDLGRETAALQLSLQAIKQRYGALPEFKDEQARIGRCLDGFENYRDALLRLADIPDLSLANQTKQEVLGQFLEMLAPLGAGALPKRMRMGREYAKRQADLPANTGEQNGEKASLDIMQEWARISDILIEIISTIDTELDPRSPLKDRIAKRFDYIAALGEYPPNPESPRALQHRMFSASAYATETAHGLHEAFHKPANPITDKYVSRLSTTLRDAADALSKNHRKYDDLSLEDLAEMKRQFDTMQQALRKAPGQGGLTRAGGSAEAIAAARNALEEAIKAKTPGH